MAVDPQPAAPPPTPPAGRRPLAWILAASACAHVWCLGSQFYLDDGAAILHNPRLLGLAPLRIGSNAWTELGYFVQMRWLGGSAVVFHAVNWLLHTAAACMLFLLGRGLLETIGWDDHPAAVRGAADVVRPGVTAANVAWFAGLWFAVHPLASEIPNYARTQDLAWVTLFSLLAGWTGLRFLRGAGIFYLWGSLLAVAGATFSKGPGLVHALLAVAAVAVVAVGPPHWQMIRRRWYWALALGLAGALLLERTGILRDLVGRTGDWGEPRFIGHAYTLARVFWEFTWRAVLPLGLCSDHHIAESLVPPGSSWWNIPDRMAMLAMAAMALAALAALALTWRKPTRLLGACLGVFVATIGFRMLFLMPEFMPEYRIYPGLPWFCLGAAVGLASLWRRYLPLVSPSVPVGLLLVLLAGLSARRSFVWHDADRLAVDILNRYPAQVRVVWELHDRDAEAGRWQRIIDRQRTLWPRVFQRFITENRRLAPERELPGGHVALADVACGGRHALALAHVKGAAAAHAEIRRLHQHMRELGLDPEAHRIHWEYFHGAKALVLEATGDPRAALELMRREKIDVYHPEHVRRLEQKITRRL